MFTHVSIVLSSSRHHAVSTFLIAIITVSDTSDAFHQSPKMPVDVAHR